ncbi:hypothetical protein DL93DRAFT_2193131 [Clavulina sp. PMI_390]|nr:hypothetical protein DL93DRAFT_2193131 [Clavulina sp. PMI_390]
MARVSISGNERTLAAAGLLGIYVVCVESGGKGYTGTETKQWDRKRLRWHYNFRVLTAFPTIIPPGKNRPQAVSPPTPVRGVDGLERDSRQRGEESQDVNSQVNKKKGKKKAIDGGMTTKLLSAIYISSSHLAFTGRFTMVGGVDAGGTRYGALAKGPEKEKEMSECGRKATWKRGWRPFSCFRGDVLGGESEHHLVGPRSGTKNALGSISLLLDACLDSGVGGGSGLFNWIPVYRGTRVGDMDTHNGVIRNAKAGT